ncbi:hypothetical protein FOCG_16322 [Fusarium oxysporum f. sp. radicis-lycopersici 26381]|uniref:Uncharacterized protein n=5 Tax=Fusarium oxysporum TaxID=5507 RepID=W9IVW1_FUSOX|nr:hypothetical protein FOYG_02270 [Fusarium oxysporum NRRL 32931]EXA28818.1 hypothetical protein FOVG_19595 [Fusarium oxysporum f. sp. pisi HDV247]EXK27018.1 hypothetical protein FOMG_16456 [Fusarium oxysporum f. sp. melonis 26406]EXL41518.1 hypothetical protein FOCG_16322 [Fusarium oxysporum f. sp. radicis-lycopersici 26381]EXL69564.1 hypothetical protein FOPG_14504 [Fusarium oxysporum f. sp. conglutinans race 2 54008]KAJ0145470.1 Uncharacterized protein HZ326_11819 [Fusarium oxysporum f. sp
MDSNYLTLLMKYLRMYKAVYEERTSLKEVKRLSQRLRTAYEHDRISWMDFNDWMEELWAAADEGAASKIAIIDRRLNQAL